jgi:hypothetical protein
MGSGSGVAEALQVEKLGGEGRKTQTGGLLFSEGGTAELERAGETGLRFEILVLWLQDGDSYRSTYNKRSRGSGSSRVKTISASGSTIGHDGVWIAGFDWRSVYRDFSIKTGLSIIGGLQSNNAVQQCPRNAASSDIYGRSSAAPQLAARASHLRFGVSSRIFDCSSPCRCIVLLTPYS